MNCMGKYHGKRGHQDIKLGNEAMVLSLDRHAVQAAQKPLVSAGQEIPSQGNPGDAYPSAQRCPLEQNTPGMFRKLQGSFDFPLCMGTVLVCPEVGVEMPSKSDKDHLCCLAISRHMNNEE